MVPESGMVHKNLRLRILRKVNNSIYFSQRCRLLKNWPLLSVNFLGDKLLCLQYAMPYKTLSADRHLSNTPQISSSGLEKGATENTIAKSIDYSRLNNLTL